MGGIFGWKQDATIGGHNRPPKDDLKLPDFTDEAVQQAAAAELRNINTRRGRRQTFLTGPLGDTSTAPLSSPAAGGTTPSKFKTLLGGY